MAWFWVGIGVLLFGAIGAAAVFDRRARRKGHRLRGVGSIRRALRDNRRDARTVDSRGVAAAGVTWTDYFRAKRVKADD